MTLLDNQGRAVHDSIAFREIAEMVLSAEPRSSDERSLSHLVSAFWRGEFTNAVFAIRRYLAEENAWARDNDDRVRLKGLPAYDQPQKADYIGLRRYVYGLLYDLPHLPDGRPCLVLPEIDGGEEGEVSAFDELANWPLEAYPLKARCVLENIAVDRTEFQRWAEPQAQFRAALPVILANSESQLTTNAEGQSEPDTQAKPSSTIGAETKCHNWLLSKMKVGAPEMPKKDYLAIAIEKFDVSHRGFDRAWAHAVEISGNTAWSRPGRKS